MPLLKMQSVTKEYLLGQTTVNALRGIDLELEGGEFAAIWGPSGSGKTSLLNLIGLIDVPTAGEILFAGRNVAHLGDKVLAEMRNHLIGFVFQNFNLVGVLSAVENVMLPLQIRGMPTREARAGALESLSEVGLGSLAGTRPDQMSGGQRQRVAIARALVTRPVIVLADEPTANLDSQTSQQIVDLMRELNQRSGVTFVFATHDPRLLDNVSRHIRLEDGRIARRSAEHVLV